VADPPGGQPHALLKSGSKSICGGCGYPPRSRSLGEHPEFFFGIFCDLIRTTYKRISHCKKVKGFMCVGSRRFINCALSEIPAKPHRFDFSNG
jgi:hypothetical protein